MIAQFLCKFMAMTRFGGAAVPVGLALGLFAAAAPAIAWPAEATRELAVREGPGQEYPHIEVIPAGTVVDIQHCDIDRIWCRVDTNGTVGYLRGTFLQRVGDVYLGPRVETYTTYRSRHWVGPPPRPHYREYGGRDYGHRHHHGRW